MIIALIILGFWDVVKPKEAVEYICKHIDMDSNTLCKQLLDLSSERCSNDNITVLLIKFALPKQNNLSEPTNTPIETPP